MPEMIDRHALLKKVYEHPRERERMTDGEWCRKCIYEAPKVEVEPVRHGRWIPSKTITGGYDCSFCGWTVTAITSMNAPYCHCGAKMDATDTNVGGKGGTENG